jgi:hypothetical protein
MDLHAPRRTAGVGTWARSGVLRDRRETDRRSTGRRTGPSERHVERQADRSCPAGGVPARPPDRAPDRRPRRPRTGQWPRHRAPAPGRPDDRGPRRDVSRSRRPISTRPHGSGRPTRAWPPRRWSDVLGVGTTGPTGVASMEPETPGFRASVASVADPRPRADEAGCVGGPGGRKRARTGRVRGVVGSLRDGDRDPARGGIRWWHGASGGCSERSRGRPIPRRPGLRRRRGRDRRRVRDGGDHPGEDPRAGSHDRDPRRSDLPGRLRLDRHAAARPLRTRRSAALDTPSAVAVVGTRRATDHGRASRGD